MQKILLIEDDGAILASLGAYLRQHGYWVRTVTGEQEAAYALTEERFDLALIDITLQNGSGFGVLEKARLKGLPAIFLTAEEEEASVVRSFQEGAYDYVVKPFRPLELLARIQSVLDRQRGQGAFLDLGAVIVNLERGTVSREGQEFALSALELRLLQTLLANRGRVLSRSRLLEEIWDVGGDFVNDNTLSVYIKRLREKLEGDPKNPVLIVTVRGLGYRMD